MNFLRSIWRSDFLIKLRSWEYWPFLVVYWPIFIYWIWLSIRAKSFFYFSASNPGIENGGMLGESKIKILDKIPEGLKPKSKLIEPEQSFSSVANLAKEEFEFPFICKPDIGERGWRVEKINNEAEFEEYHVHSKTEYIIQEFLTEKIEMGIFYYRYPNENKGIVSSIVVKEMLTLTGDGHSTLKELILNNDRSKLQWSVLKHKYSSQLETILSKNQQIELVAIGNHSRGTKFLNGNYLINQDLNEVFDEISQHIDGFYFGRFDIKVGSHENLYSGKVKIMELNGAGSEPAHIYDPKHSLISAYKVIFHHWKVLYKISVINHKRGVPYMTFYEALKEYKKIKSIEK